MKRSFYHHLHGAAVLQATGEEAFDYLQSQLSNDLRRVDGDHGAYAYWLDRKGKVQADSFVLRVSAECFFLVSPFTDAGRLHALAEGNVIADDVEFERIDADWNVFLFWAEGAAEPRDAAGCAAFEVAQVGAGYVLTPPLIGQPFAIFLLPASAAGEVPQMLRAWAEKYWQTDAEPELSPLAAFHALRWEARFAFPPMELTPGDLPQEALRGEEAVSYTKGCYLGQEVMARLHSMGKTQRVLAAVELEDCVAHAIAEFPVTLYCGEKKAGELREPIAIPGKAVAFAMLKRSLLDAGQTLTIKGTEKPVLRRIFT